MSDDKEDPMVEYWKRRSTFMGGFVILFAVVAGIVFVIGIAAQHEFNRRIRELEKELAETREAEKKASRALVAKVLEHQ